MTSAQKLPNLHVSFGSTTNLKSARIADTLVSADTPYRGRMLRYIWAKHRLPVISVQDVVTVDVTELGGKASTPYRLPRIEVENPRRCYQQPLYSARLWGPYGYENIVRIPELGPEIKRQEVNPSKSLAAEYRRTSMSVPTFRTAAITPTMKAIPINIETSEDIDIYQSYLSKAKTGELESIPPAPTPTPVSRSLSPTKSVKSIHWALGNTQHPLFDKKGRGRVQGPYSREFTVTCGAPNNWLKMKLGRSRVALHT